MYSIRVNNVNEALPIGLALLRDCGVRVAPRGEATIEYPGPVATTYIEPCHRVLMDKVRDANPFFHLFESLWILAGRSDVAFLEQFNSNIANYSDDGVVFHAPYGHRLRKAFGFDQIEAVIKELDENPDSRRAVLCIWDPRSDLNQQSKDIPCNDTIFFKLRKRRLNMTVCCRSNDVVWGAYGANAVQFSMLLEYVAAHLAVPVGQYTQISDSFHVYEKVPYWQQWLTAHQSGYYTSDPYIDMTTYPLFRQIKLFDFDLLQFFRQYDIGQLPHMTCVSTTFGYVVLPMLRAWMSYKKRNIDKAIFEASAIISEDWSTACKQWLERRLPKEEGQHADA